MTGLRGWRLKRKLLGVYFPNKISNTEAVTKPSEIQVQKELGGTETK